MVRIAQWLHDLRESRFLKHLHGSWEIAPKMMRRMLGGNVAQTMGKPSLQDFSDKDSMQLMAELTSEEAGVHEFCASCRQHETCN